MRDEHMLAARQQSAQGGLTLPLFLHGPGIFLEDDPLAGHMFLQREIAREGSRGLFDDLVGRGCCLISTHGDPVTHLSADDEAFFTSIGGQEENRMLKLDETLNTCLLAVAIRYPDSLIEINKDLLDPSDLWQGHCTVEQALNQLQVQAPQLLQARARLVIDDEQAIIALYPLDHSEEVAVLYLSSGHDGGQAWRWGLHESVITLQEGEVLLDPSQSGQQ